MKTYQFESEILINKPRNEVFQFFSNAENLEQITPSSLKFKILTPLPISMAKGIRINYRLTIYGIPLNWKTEIIEWNPPYRFVDFQLKGPYKSWIHEHIFEESGNNCLIKDKVIYQLKGGILAPLIHRLFVKKDVAKIFNYRSKIIKTLF